MRGRYAPLPSRYSRPLRKLVDSMLAVNPSERPSFAQILRMPFIKKHICNLIRDIAARCVGLRGLRWGALVVTRPLLQQLHRRWHHGFQGGRHGRCRVVSAGPGLPGPSRGAHEADAVAWIAGMCAPQCHASVQDSPRWPLHRHQSVVQVALRDPSEDPDPTTAATRDPKSAKKILRQRKNALSRERERQQAVEQALQRLKAEKEMRMKQREALRAKQQRRLRGGVRCVVFARGC